jgi:hypothetical protein
MKALFRDFGFVELECSMTEESRNLQHVADLSKVGDTVGVGRKYGRPSLMEVPIP